MVFNQSILKVIDNTGIKKTKCIKVYKKNKASIGDKILVSVKKIKKTLQKKNLNLEKSQKLKAIVVQTKKQFKNLSNNLLSFNQNSIIIINQKNEPIGSKILGPVPTILRKKKFFKLILISTNIL